ncbi:hypothetical protein BUALT_Bualt07G0004300 [Buddleja alternifolia]|uniref:DUF4408 domain-containing protein n=1 Tax=Buddleja alternifolia TaxID=168488 RepID=A0AAV6XET7_9LAMI|nr:hypothetical protein BUALT_Bualt07G0004300 [Buddleja alternifolia]
MAFLFVDSLPQNNSRVLQNSIKALELLLLSLGLISTLVMVKGAVNMPYSCEIVFSSLVGFWTSIRCFLSSPLYICIIINFMVVLIAASSAFHRHENEPDNHDDEIKVSFDVDMQNDVSSPPPPSPPQSFPEKDVSKNSAPLLPRDVTKVAAPPPPPLSTTTSTLYFQDDIFLSEAITSLHQNISEENHSEKAILSSLSFNEGLMFQEHEIKKTTNSLNTSENLPEPTKGIEKFARNLSHDKENEEEDTMEATWNAITGGGKQKPKKKHLKKSETWDVPPRNTTAEESQPSIPSWKELRKSETFNDAVSITRRGGLRRDPSMSIDEFNKQVEAFIKKFNDNMRLQRQESDQRFLDMVNRGH